MRNNSEKKLTVKNTANESTLDKEKNQKARLHIERRLTVLRNEMELVEIICNFWPLPNMNSRHERLKNQVDDLFQELAELTQQALLAEEAKRQPYSVMHQNHFKQRAHIT
ncbi:MAG: hypothetical protein K2X66_10615 [Cyanobacteria bacterium]|nr:hypothetical protein [Cyanobacteriota bacterium]